jgi:hypothetical protein
MRITPMLVTAAAILIPHDQYQCGNIRIPEVGGTVLSLNARFWYFAHSNGTSKDRQILITLFYDVEKHGDTAKYTISFTFHGDN